MNGAELTSSELKELEQIGEVLEYQSVSLPGPLEAQPQDHAYNCFSSAVLNPTKNVGKAISVGAALFFLAGDGV